MIFYFLNSIYSNSVRFNRWELPGESFKEALQQPMDTSARLVSSLPVLITAVIRPIASFSWRFLWVLASVTAIGIVNPVQAQTYPQAAYPEAGGVLQPNDQGGAVADLQQRLADLGYYNGPVTGYFDSSTQEAVSRFQQANGLAVDGIVGAATNSALGGSYSANSGSQAGQSGSYVQLDAAGDSVTALQQQLIQLGYYNGAVTGVFDQQTQAAVMNFQRDRGLAVDGIVGSATEAALNQAPAQPVAATGTATTTTATTPSATTPSATAAYTPVSTPSDGLLQLGDAGAEVSDLQTRLQTLGYYDGPISGSFGSQTQSALMAFQQAQGLTVDGIAGPRVNAALDTVATSSPVAASQPVTSPPVTSQPVTSQPGVTPAPAIPATPQPVAATNSTTPAIQTSPIPTVPLTQPQPTGTVQVPALPDPTASNQPFQTTQSEPSTNRQMMQRSLEGSRFSVMELQRRLQLRGFEPVETTGVYDSATQNAVNQAQEAYGLSPSDLFE